MHGQDYGRTKLQKRKEPTMFEVVQFVRSGKPCIYEKYSSAAVNRQICKAISRGYLKDEVTVTPKGMEFFDKVPAW